MQIILQRFDASSLQFIDEAIATDPELTRTQLAKLVCEQFDWRSPNGHYQTTACAIGLRRLLFCLRSPPLIWPPRCLV